jgi:hypothetical protein
MALKYTTKQMKIEFKKRGCKLLGEYCGALTKMKYQCSCGQISEISWNNFSRGRRCGYCHPTGRKKKYTLEEVQKIYKDRGCEFLEDEFKGIIHIYKYRCECGRICKKQFSAFYHQDQLCHECGLEKNQKEGHHMWIADREQKRLNDLFRKKCYKSLRSTLKATNQEKVGKTTELLGYTPQQLREHIESHPDWKKVKNADWQLDHIFPIYAFVEHDIKDISLINSLDNLRPATRKKNRDKWYKYDKNKFHKWLKSKGFDP